MHSLLARKGCGRKPKLTDEQKSQVFDWVNGKNPMQHGLDVALWARETVRELIRQKLGISLSLTSVGSLLTELNLVPPKPLHRACGRDLEVLDRWRRDTLPALAKQAGAEGAEIYFWDDSVFRAGVADGEPRGESGKTAVDHPGPEQIIHAARAVSAKGAFWFATYEGDLTGDRFVGLLTQLTSCRRKPLHLVLGGLPVHQEAVVNAYLQGEEGRLVLHYLPDRRARSGGSRARARTARADRRWQEHAQAR